MPSAYAATLTARTGATFACATPSAHTGRGNRLTIPCPNCRPVSRQQFVLFTDDLQRATWTERAPQPRSR